MTSNDLYLQILGLTPPWSVSDVILDMSAQTVHVYVVHDPLAGRLRCSSCGRDCPGYDTQEERIWRHLDTCQLKTFLVCSLPRVECPDHGVRPAEASWTAPSSRFTLMFECFAIAVLQATKVQRNAAQLLGLSPNQIHDIMDRAVERGMARRDTERVIYRASLDEKSIAAGHEYMTVLADSSRGIVIEVANGRTLSATRSLLKSALSARQREKIECVTMDMWRPFADAVTSELPGAEIAHDPFHIAKYLGTAVDDTRKAEHARLVKEGKSPLTKSKYLWLKNPRNLTSAQNAMLLDLQNSQLMTPKVWSFKEAFKEFYKCKKPKSARTFFDNWHEQALALKSTHLTRVADMLKRHLDGLLAVIKYGASNAIAEAINSKIQALKTAARGFRRFENYRLAVLFFFGGLDLNPQLS